MGDLATTHAQNRVRTALDQCLETAETPADRQTVYEECIDRLLRIAIDDEELDRIAADFAVDGTALDWPDDTHHNQ